MMYSTRAELKQQAKSLISSHYWPVIGATFLALLIYQAATSAFSLASFFLFPILCGLTLYYLALADGKETTIGDLFNNGFDTAYYLRRVGGYAWMSLFIFLWSLLFVIPGIVKSFSYALTPYILARYPKVKAQDALKVSMTCMDGHKAELFALYLSFLGWGILSSVTLGIVGIFFVMPYLLITVTLWQRQVMEDAIMQGKFTYVEDNVIDGMADVASVPPLLQDDSSDQSNL